MAFHRPFVELQFYETYYFADLIRDLMEDRFNHLVFLHEFHGDGNHFEYVAPFPRYSAFHSFIEFVVRSAVLDEAETIKLDQRQEELRLYKSIPEALEPHPSALPVDLAFQRYKISGDGFAGWLKDRDKSFEDATRDDLGDYYEELVFESGEFQDLLARVADDVFYVLFQNRRILMLFNDMMAERMVNDDSDVPDDYASHFRSKGVLHRVRIPAWTREAVFFRDRGHCAICNRDISGLLTLSTVKNFDHIVPLAQGGLNDVSNIQLLCDRCNVKKSKGHALTSQRYECWYRMSRDD